MSRTTTASAAERCVELLVERGLIRDLGKAEARVLFACLARSSASGLVGAGSDDLEVMTGLHRVSVHRAVASLARKGLVDPGHEGESGRAYALRLRLGE